MLIGNDAGFINPAYGLPQACHKKQEIFLSGLLTWVGGMARFGY
jgi:hypothetical protein